MKRPKARGLPGFIRTVQKRTSPSRASTSLTTSKSPRDTPADVTTMSAAATASAIFAVSAGTVSSAMPDSTGTPPYSSTSAARPEALLS